MPGSGWPVSSATTRSRTSLRSVTRSAISPPAAANMALSSSIAADGGGAEARAGAEALGHQGDEAAVAGRVAVAISTSEAAPLA